MDGIKISEAVPKSPLDGTEYVPIGGAGDYRTTTRDIANINGRYVDFTDNVTLHELNSPQDIEESVGEPAGYAYEYTVQTADVVPHDKILKYGLHLGFEISTTEQNGTPSKAILTLTGGSSGSIDSIKMDAFDIITNSVPYNTSLAQTCIDIAARINLEKQPISLSFWKAKAVGNTVEIDTYIFTGQFDGNSLIVTATTLTHTDVDFDSGVEDFPTDPLYQIDLTGNAGTGSIDSIDIGGVFSLIDNSVPFNTDNETTAQDLVDEINTTNEACWGMNFEAYRKDAKVFFHTSTNSILLYLYNGNITVNKTDITAVEEYTDAIVIHPAVNIKVFVNDVAMGLPDLSHEMGVINDPVYNFTLVISPTDLQYIIGNVCEMDEMVNGDVIGIKIWSRTSDKCVLKKAQILFLPDNILNERGALPLGWGKGITLQPDTVETEDEITHSHFNYCSTLGPPVPFAGGDNIGFYESIRVSPKKQGVAHVFLQTEINHFKSSEISSILVDGTELLTATITNYAILYDFITALVNNINANSLVSGYNAVINPSDFFIYTNAYTSASNGKPVIITSVDCLPTMMEHSYAEDPNAWTIGGGLDSSIFDINIDNTGDSIITPERNITNKNKFFELTTPHTNHWRSQTVNLDDFIISWFFF